MGVEPGFARARILPRLDSDRPDVLMDGQRIAGAVEGKFVVLDGVGSVDHCFERTK